MGTSCDSHTESLSLFMLTRTKAIPLHIELVQSAIVTE